MGNLKFKTRGMVSPQGMPRVYFSCHPKDFERYFEKISEDILKKQNCAIFYRDESETHDENELFLDLGQMQLFVMPVTSNLLFDPNRAIDSEFAFAIEKLIPVLPIMQENGLEEHFNKKCGDLQFLDPNSKDLTAISYDEKLEKYLSSVLIGDELAAKVRAAFDAYVFLSYRKKDRKYAQELMRLIHKNDFCRDIAIWYDEFLTPGENFNDSIEDALNKSGLFVMAVTPNLVNEPNYIMSTEYPMAKEKNKPVLPAELVETDRKLLEECYKDIPVCTDAHNEAALNDSLLKAVQAMAKRENDSSPEHNFFIGLAYLSGIDVEVDHERAVSLITSAAEAGLPEAMKKLVTMYRNGEGVICDYDTAINWQKKSVDSSEKLFEKEKTVANLREYVHEIYLLGDLSIDVAYYDCSESTFEILVAKAAKLVEKNDNPDDIEYYRLAHLGLAKTFEEKGDLSKAKDFYLKAYMIANTVYKYNQSVENAVKITKCIESVGLICRKKGEFSQAKELYQNALELYTKIEHSDNSLHIKRSIAGIYDSLAEIAFLEENYFEANQLCTQSLRIAKNLSEISGEISDDLLLAATYNNLSNISAKSNQYKATYWALSKAREISKGILNNQKCIAAEEILSASFLNTASAQIEEKNLYSAVINMGEGIEIKENICKKDNSISKKIDLASAYTKYGELLKMIPDDENGLFDEISQEPSNKVKAEMYLTKAYEILNDLSLQTDDIRITIAMVDCCFRLGTLNDEPDKTYLSQAKNHLETLQKAGIKENKVSADIELINNILGVTNMNKEMEYFYQFYESAILSAMQGNSPAAKKQLSDAISLGEKLLNEYDVLDLRRKVAMLYNQYAILFTKENDLTTAKTYEERSNNLLKENYLKASTPDLARDYYTSCNTLGNILVNLKNNYDAEKYFETAMHLSYELCVKEGAERDYDTYAYSVYMLAINNHDIELLEKAESAWLEASKKFPHNNSFANSAASVRNTINELNLQIQQDVLLDYFNMGEEYSAQRNYEMAKCAYNMAIKHAEKMLSEAKVPMVYDDLTLLYYKIATLNGANNETYLNKAYEYCCTLLQLCPNEPNYIARKNELERLINQNKGFFSKIKKGFFN